MCLTEAWTQQNTNLVGLQRNQYGVYRQKHRKERKNDKNRTGSKKRSNIPCVYSEFWEEERYTGAEEILGEIKLIKSRLNCRFR